MQLRPQCISLGTQNRFGKGRCLALLTVVYTLHVNKNLCGYPELLPDTFAHYKNKKILENKAIFHESREALICDTNIIK